MYSDREIVCRWMKIHAAEYETATALAEGAAHHMDQDKWLDNPDHAVWEWALIYKPGD
jgi:hypothetical protein